MLRSLIIQNVVLIERLAIEFKEGLCALTGETGAGKSILLDSLGLALGARGDSTLVRKGAEEASVTAAFEVAESHPVYLALAEGGIEADEGGQLLLRRVLSVEGKSRAYINDQPVSISYLRKVGDSLVEIHGQFEAQGLLNPATHRAMLDEYAKTTHNLPALWDAWKQTEKHLEDLRVGAAKARAEEDWLRAAKEDLEHWNPVEGEEAQLAALRESLMHREQILESLGTAWQALNGEDDPLRRAYAALSRAAEKMGETANPALEALDRALLEVQESAGQIESLSSSLEDNPHDLESIDERLFGLRALARKLSCSMEDLPRLHAEIKAQLESLEEGGDGLTKAAAKVEEARSTYIAQSKILRTAREKAAKKLDELVQAELPPLKLDRAKFVTQITPLDESAWGPEGTERVRFLVATNPGANPGPIEKIASGGELSRFILALKVIIAQEGSVHSFIFDEVDTGIGGSTADAVGERLARLARGRQVLVVTHAPQIAARASAHWIVEKSEKGGAVKTAILPLETRTARCEEIARMLAGATITKEARAAAEKLLENAA
ncbi:MAG: DNA repair protein RecN [Alphaproteobacteria bacterium]|nr:DNA repair protein RecN [Alphaproteobacteria bacterium]